ncbi:hypothetical protein QYE76_070055 [Lolium multiflorum]|uniref:Gag-pol polyprotein n=1 Tax=Lolium multiflorum TaxID=4521 RepID=A0AAD8WE39_LOLMU|nr:hypothetical protein QYE76_070055 [Lolium multiflorum]
MEQISTILRDQFGIVPKRRTVGYSKPYPNEYDLIPLPPKYRLPEFSKFNGSEGSSSIEHDQLLGGTPRCHQIQSGRGSNWKSSFIFNITQKLPRLALPIGAGPVYHHGRDKEETGHSRGKEKEEAGPRDRPRYDDRRYVTEEQVRNVRYQRPLSTHLLNKYERQYDRRRRYDTDDERYRRSDVDNRKYRRYDRDDEGYERRAKGKSREQEDVDRHWDCPFFKHCWDSGMSRLPTIDNCPECRQQKKDMGEVSVFKRLGPLPSQNRRAESSRVEDVEESEDFEESEDEEEDRYHWPSIDLAGDGKLGYGFTSADELEEIDIGPGDKPRPTFISKKLDPHLRGLMIALLKEYPDCFAWDYTEMPGLDRSIIEHRLPLKKGFRPFQQRARQMKAEILEEVKKEIEKMLNAGFIRPCRYAEWISSIVPVEKKDGQWRVAIDFRDLNRATPKDEYPMPVAETLINAAAGHKVLSFMDGNAGYNQIFMAPEDIHKTAFRVPGSVGLFEYVVMKNAGATYQRAMNYIFHDLIGKLVEIYIDDVVVKSVSVEGHLEDLRRILDRTRKFGLRMNPKKCAFGVTAGQFLGFLVHERGIEIGLKSQEAVRTMKPPTTKKELQCLIGKINFVRRFISNLSGRIEPFMGLVKIKSDEEFRWGAEQQRAFDEIKEYLTKPPVLVPPQQDRPFYIYLSVADTSIASVVVQVYDGLERVAFYLSRRMLDAETRYPEIEKLCLCLFFTCTKLHHILLSAEIVIICKSDVIKHMLSAPVLKGRLGKWMFALSEFDLRYQPAKAVKGQALADLIAERINTDIAALSVRAWAMFFDGSACDDGCGIGILLVSPRGATYSFSIRLPTPCTNNVAE